MLTTLGYLVGISFAYWLGRIHERRKQMKLRDGAAILVPMTYAQRHAQGDDR